MTSFPLTELRTLQASIGAANAAKGFHDEGDLLRFEVANPFLGKSTGADAMARSDAANLRNYYANKLLLVVSEVVEAHDELRKGRAVDETYYPTYCDGATGPFKPEGVESEIADVVIRCFDFADEAGLDLAAMIREKLLFNASREKLHGKAF